MKAIGAVCVLMVLGASGAGAVDIQGKWGIGAGVFGGGGEISLIRGRSERSAWLFDLRLSQQDRSLPQFNLLPSTESDVISVTAGPGYRRYARAADEFSPYWDATLHALYARRHEGSGGDTITFRQAGAEAGFSFGLEYFTRWHFSVAAHSRLVTISWTRDNLRRTSSGTDFRSSGHSEAASVGLSPALFVRGYF